LLKLSLVGLPKEAANKFPSQLSGGMQRRAAAARAIAMDPELLFLDEPTTGLDPMSRLTLWEEVKRLNAGGTTVLLTTQYLEEADQLADRVAIIDHGRIVRQGAPRELKAMVGSPTLSIKVGSDQTEEARSILARFGDLRTTSEGTLGVGLARGAEDVATVIRALDEAGLKVRHLELDEPSLDDVFAEATGYRLEGAGTTAAGEKNSDAVDAQESKSRRKRRNRS
jgi:ABC-2 type transport system ATP-binding protein